MDKSTYDRAREARNAKDQIDVQDTDRADDLLYTLLEAAWPSQESQKQ